MWRTLAVVVFLGVASGALGMDPFVKKYAYQKVMTNCAGEDMYYGWLHKVMITAKTCRGEEINLPPKEEPGHADREYSHEEGITSESGEEEDIVDMMLPEELKKKLGSTKTVYLPVFLSRDGQQGGQVMPFNFPYQILGRRQKREMIYDAPVLKAMLAKVKAKVSNFTCVLQKLNYLDEDFNLNFTFMAEELATLSIPEPLREDFQKAFGYCRDLTMCLPLEKTKSPMPIKLQQAVAFFKCDKKARLGVCMKHDLLRYLGGFDLSAFPNIGEDEGEIAEKLLHVLWGSESKDDFELY